MKTAALRKWINAGLYLSGCILAGTGLGMELGNRGAGDLHFIVAVIFMCLAAVHIWLGKEWLLKVLAKGERRLYLGFVALGLLLLVVFMFLPINDEEGGHHGPHGKGPAGLINADLMGKASPQRD